jgi:hypothetical protein
VIRNLNWRDDIGLVHDEQQERKKSKKKRTRRLVLPCTAMALKKQVATGEGTYIINSKENYG